MNISSTYLPTDAYALFKEWERPWWIAGGWALDLFLGKTTRSHEDLDIAVLRQDQFLARTYLKNWDMYIGLGDGAISDAPWDGTTFIEAPTPALWCKETNQSEWAFELLLTDSSNGQWQSRRNARITLPIESIGHTTSSGIPYLSPEIVLSYKAKDRGLSKDQDDFTSILPYLNAMQRDWLKQTIQTTNPGHIWLNSL